MANTSGLLRTSPSGEEIVGENDGDNLVWSSELEIWIAQPPSGGGGGGGAVDSVFGRTGVVVAEPGDYAETGSALGYLARYVYVNPSDPDVGVINNEGNTLLAAVTWTTPDDIPPGNLFEIVCWGGGGAGSNGLQHSLIEADFARGPTGAGGGARIARWFSRRELIAALPIAMTIPLRAAPPVLATTNHQISVGSPGGNTFFGSLVTAYGGGPGRTRDNVSEYGGSGGGSRGPGVNEATGGAPGGYPRRSPSAVEDFGRAEGGAGTVFGGSSDGQFGALGGGGSGAGSAAPGVNPGRHGGCSEQGGGGGGSPGTSSASPSGDGGKSGPSLTGSIIGGGGAAGTLGFQDGQKGADGFHYNSGDGGGAGFSRMVDPEVQAGAGGNGGDPAGGGGSGGSGRGPNGSAWAGQGGFGGRGQITVTAYD